MTENFNIVENKLKGFIKKYQIYKLLKGIFFSIAILILFLITESVIEFFSYLSINTRTFLFYLSLIFLIFVFVYFFILPTLVLFNLKKGINYKDANNLIKNYFPEIKDKLINTIELSKNKENKSDLLIASIEQKTLELKPFNFSLAINFNFIKRNFLYFITSILILLFIYSFAPKILFQGTNRLINHNVYFEKAAPFKFKIKNKNFNIQQGDNFEVDVKIVGKYVPNTVFISIGNNKFKMNRNENGDKNTFNYSIRNINNSINISFFADNYTSKLFKIKVLPSPVLQNFNVTIIPPSYTGLKKKKYLNVGDFTVPEGTKILWKFDVSNTNEISFITQTDTNYISNFKSKPFIKTFKKSTKYQISLKNNYFNSKQKIEYYIKTIADEFPIINLKEIEDSLKIGAFYFLSNIKDDYGFTKLEFVCNIKDKKDSLQKSIVKEIDINKNNINQNIFYYFNFAEIENKFSDYYYEYYLKIYDNDYINGFKAAISQKNMYKPLSVSDIKQKINNLDEKTKSFLDKSKDLTNEIRNDVENYKKKELNKELSEWDKQNFANSLIKKQKKLEDLLNQMSKDNKKRNKFNNQFNKEQNELLEKQKQIQKLLDEIMDKEIRDLMKELKKLQEQFNNKKFENIKKNIDISYKELNKKLERSLELLKRYKIEENVLHNAEDLKKLSEKQKNISKQKINKTNKEDIKNKEKLLKNELNKIKKNFDKNLNDNKELKKPFSLEKFNKDFNKINKDFNELDSNLTNKPSKKNNKQSKEKQNEISKELDKMSKQMQKMFGNMQKQTMQTSMEDLRQIIENLSSFSNEQEEIYKKLKQTFINNPLYPELTKQQNKIKNDFLLINDSLQSLAKQLPQLKSIVLKEVKNINLNLSQSTEKIEQKLRRGTMRSQRHIINSTNILALYLDELKDQLQKQMSNSGSGKGQKSNKKKMGKMKSAQENFKQMLKQMLEQMKNGKLDPASYNKRIVKMLKEQEIFNKLLGEMQNGEGISPEANKKLKEIKRMTDKNIQDLINKRIDNNLLERNNKILTRLLEAENAEKKRDKEKKRESEKAKDIKIKIPDELKKELDKSLKNSELLQKNNIKLKNYYKNLSKEYFININ